MGFKLFLVTTRQFKHYRYTGFGIQLEMEEKAILQD